MQSDENWQAYLNRVRYGELPLILVSLCSLLLLSSFRDIVFTNFDTPLWLISLNLIGLVVISSATVLAALEKIPERLGESVLSICALFVCVKPAIIVLTDNTPATLVLATFIFISGLVFLSVASLALAQLVTLAAWLFIVRNDIVELPYLVTVAMAVIAGGLGYWIQVERLRSYRRNYYLEKRVESLETILPMCANCKNTRDENGNWLSIEEYVESQADTQISHGICPDCKKKLYGKYAT